MAAWAARRRSSCEWSRLHDSDPVHPLYTHTHLNTPLHPAAIPLHPVASHCKPPQVDEAFLFAKHGNADGATDAASANMVASDAAAAGAASDPAGGELTPRAVTPARGVTPRGGRRPQLDAEGVARVHSYKQTGRQHLKPRVPPPAPRPDTAPPPAPTLPDRAAFFAPRAPPTSRSAPSRAPRPAAPPDTDALEILPHLSAASPTNSPTAARAGDLSARDARLIAAAAAPRPATSPPSVISPRAHHDFDFVVGHSPATGTAAAAVTGTTAAAAAAGAGGAAAAALKAAVPDSTSAGAARRAVDGYVLEAEELLRLRSAGEGVDPSEAVRLLAAALQRGGAALPQRDAATTPLALATDLAREMVGAADACMLLWARGGGVPTVLRGRDRRGAALTTRLLAQPPVAALLSRAALRFDPVLLHRPGATPPQVHPILHHAPCTMHCALCTMQPRNHALGTLHTPLRANSEASLQHHFRAISAPLQRPAAAPITAEVAAHASHCRRPITAEEKVD